MKNESFAGKPGWRISRCWRQRKIWVSKGVHDPYLGGTRFMFSWDDTLVGFQVLIARVYLNIIHYLS